MVFTVYISYSIKDKGLVNSLYSVLRQSGINVYAIEMTDLRTPLRGPFLQDRKRFINSSDYVLVLLTKDAVSSPNIFLEIGMAKASSKPIMLIVEPDVKLPKEIVGIPFIILDRKRPESAFRQIEQVSTELKLKKERGNPVVGILFLLIALGFLSWLSSEG
jgi:hypothetical protein